MELSISNAILFVLKTEIPKSTILDATVKEFHLSKVLLRPVVNCHF